MTAVDLAADHGHGGNPRLLGTQYPDNANTDLLSRIPADARTILDVGCGTGALGAAYRALNSGARLLGIERDPEMAAIARQRLDAVACVDVEQNPLPFELPEGIDCLIYGDVLQQLRDPWTVLRRQLDALNPGGSVLVCVANAEHWSMVARLLRGTWDYERAGLLDVRHLRWFGLRNVMRELVDAGLAVEEVHPRIFAPEQAQQFVQTLAPGLRRLGIDPGGYLPRAMPLQYVMRARRAEVETMAASAAERGADQSLSDNTDRIEAPILEESIPAVSDTIDDSANAATRASHRLHAPIVPKDTPFVSRSLLSMTETVDLERLRDTPFSRAVLAPADTIPMPPCYVMNPPSAPLSLSDTPHKQIFPRQMPCPEMWVARLDDVYYLPCGAPFLPDPRILINDFLVPGSPDAVGWFKYEGEGTYRLPVEIDLDEADCVDTAFFMGHPTSGDFGHFVGDCLSRMHAWQDCRKLFGDVKIVLDYATHDTRFSDKLLACAGVNAEDIVFAQGVVRCRKLLFASTALSVLRYASPTSAKLWQQIRDALASSHAEGAERVYLSASSQSAPKLTNEPELENLFRNFGFIIVRPEDRPLEEQISIVSNAQLIAGPVGSAMFNLAFQRRLKSALILLPETFVRNSEWLFLAGAKCPVYYHFGLRDMPAGSPVSEADAWRVDVSQLASDVASWLWGYEALSPADRRISSRIEDSPATSPAERLEPKAAIQSAPPLPSDAKETIDHSRGGGVVAAVGAEGAVQGDGSGVPAGGGGRGGTAAAGANDAAPGSVELPPRQEVSAAEIAREIVYFERSEPFVQRSRLELGSTFTDETAKPFACPGLTADVRSFRFSNVVLNTACMLLFDGDRPIKDTHYLLHDAQFRDARILPDRLVEVPAGQSYIIGCNRDYANYYHWLIQALPAMDCGARARDSSQPCLALPPLTSWQERSLELLGLAALPRLTVDIASHYLFPDVEYSEFLNGRTAFHISSRAIETFRRMQSAVPFKPTRHAVIYVARTDTGQRVASNETELIGRLEQEGVGIIVPGSLSLDDQINTFRGARLVIGPHGAGLSNVVFCEPGAMLYELIPAHYRNCCMNRLAFAAGIHYTADLFSSSGEGWVHDRPWEYDLDRIIDRVKTLKMKIQQAPPGIIATPPGPEEELPLKGLLMNFESLGDNCEFGLVQRQAGAEPLGLLRFASPYVPVEVRPEAIAAALRKRFSGLGEPSTVHLVPEGKSPPRELIVRESVYQLMHHTFIHEGEVDPENFRIKEARRLIFLRDKLVADLIAAEKIWVWKSNVTLSSGQISDLLNAIGAYGPNVLLWVVTADAAHPSGSVERVAPCLLKGYVSRFAPYGNAGDIAFDDWYEVCRNAYAIWREKKPPSIPEVLPVVAIEHDVVPPPTADGSLDQPLATTTICSSVSAALPEAPKIDFQSIPQAKPSRDTDWGGFAESNERFLQRAQAGYYDFLDLGTRDAGGFVVGSQLGGRRGLGFDNEPNFVRKNLAAGRDVVCADVTELGMMNLRSKFAVCHHILEHLPSIYDVGQVVRALARSCSDFLFIAGPCFDHENYLYQRGLKAFHSAMLDHTCRFTTFDLMGLLHGLGLRRYAIGVSLPMENSDSEFIVGAAAPNEVWQWEALRALPRPRVIFEPVLYRDIVCVVALNDTVDPIAKLKSYKFAEQKVEKIVHVASW